MQILRTEKQIEQDYHCNVLGDDVVISYITILAEGQAIGIKKPDCTGLGYCPVLKILKGGANTYNWAICPKKELLAQNEQ